ncbi:MAG: NAD(P)-dependent oxidoreductase [Thermoflavifilum sp.]|nr:NAD(P)-dependent oxidoreductase [Thermoflavifilum sp.]
MIKIGLIREGKKPADHRVALTPTQCRWIMEHWPDIQILVQPSPIRCYTDAEYMQAGIQLAEDLSHCDILLGIKEVPIDMLIPEKTYLFFSHTKKKQPHNRPLMQACVQKRITLIDYECLVHEDGQRMLGFGFFAGVVGAHNGLMAFGKKTGLFNFRRAHTCHDLQELTESYYGIKLPPLKIVITGSGRVAAGILEVMGLLGIKDIPPEEFLISEFQYPVYTQLKAGDLYLRKTDRSYSREHFHAHPEEYECKFLPFTTAADILINGIYWEERMARLFSWDDLCNPHFRIRVIADITNDAGGSIPCNLGDSTIEDPVYGVDRCTRQKLPPYLPHTVDMMCVGNLPDELPRDASRYFGEQLIKYVIPELLQPQSPILEKATILHQGRLTERYAYLHDYAYVHPNLHPSPEE